MNLDASQIMQLAAAILMAIALFSAVWSAPTKIAITILLVMIPFQLVETKYGSVNVVLTYVLFAALLLSGRTLRLPMAGWIVPVLLAYFVSMSQVHPSLYGQHAIYMMLLISGFLVFWLAYNWGREILDARSIVSLLIVINVAVDLYCIAQLFAGPGTKTVLFGVEELALARNRLHGEDARLVGPFGGSAGITAEYLALTTLILAYDLMESRRVRKLWLSALIAVNLGLMIATANRGSFLTLLASFPILLFLYRHRLGAVRAVQLAVAGFALVAIASVVIVTYTDFNLMYERLAQTTEMENGLPATRAKPWPIAWENIKQKPFLGHGPRLRLLDDDTVAYKDHVVVPYPHDLYLHLLFTVGVLGLVCFMAFFLRLGVLLSRSRAASFATDYEQGLVQLGPLLLAVFLIDQVKIEFLRIGFVDYQHFVFAMFGIWLGLGSRGVRTAEEPAAHHALGWRGPATDRFGAGGTEAQRVGRTN